MAVQGATYNGTLYGYPVALETYALVYNKAYIQTPPTTWDDVASWATTFNAANPGKYGILMDVGNAYYTSIFTSAPGNELFGDSGTDATSPNLNTATSVSGMTEFQNLHSALPVDAADIATSTDDGLFSAGNVAMYITGPWNIAPFQQAGINFGVTTLPSLEGQTNPAQSFAGVRLMCVSAYSKHPAEAADFANFLTTPAMQQLRANITGAVAASSSNITYSNDAVNGFSQQMKYAVLMPSIPQMSGYWTAFNSASANIWDGQDVKTQLDAAQNAVLNQ
jgi:arabinogalactan oligomer/maltooligosaccharide transport system substrate-binding protein